MAKIYFTCPKAEAEIGSQVENYLIENGHNVIYNRSGYNRKDPDSTNTLLNDLSKSNIIIIFITPYIEKDIDMLSAIDIIVNFVKVSDYETWLIPFLRGTNYGSFFADKNYKDNCISWENYETFEDIMPQLEAKIHEFTAAKIVKDWKDIEINKKDKIEKEIKKDILNKQASDYVSEAIVELKKREIYNSRMAILWQIIGFLILLGGTLYAIYTLLQVNNTRTNDIGWLVFVIIKNIVILGLLISCSKYAFSLGKSHMDESLKNANRVHAISFGKFYLQAFGDKISTAEEIKDIFQNWNIDKESSFTKLETSNYDPKFMESLVEIIKGLTDKLSK